MALSVKKVELWRREVENRPGRLADVLGALADSGANLGIVMAYRYTGDPSIGAIEVYPVSGKKRVAAARAAGLEPLAISALRLEGVDRPGTGRAIARVLAEKGLNISFLVAQTIGRRYSAVVGFDTEAEAALAAKALRKLR